MTGSRPAGVDAACARLHSTWNSQAAADRPATRQRDVGHVFNVPMHEEVFAWLDQRLKPSKRGE